MAFILRFNEISSNIFWTDSFIRCSSTSVGLTTFPSNRNLSFSSIDVPKVSYSLRQDGNGHKTRSFIVYKSVVGMLAVLPVNLRSVSGVLLAADGSDLLWMRLRSLRTEVTFRWLFWLIIITFGEFKHLILCVESSEPRDCRKITGYTTVSKINKNEISLKDGDIKIKQTRLENEELQLTMIKFRKFRMDDDSICSKFQNTGPLILQSCNYYASLYTLYDLMLCSPFHDFTVFSRVLSLNVFFIHCSFRLAS